MTYPRITLVTPSFQQADFLEETIQSVLSQKYENLEYIIIDGGSTDGSTAIIEKYAAQLAHWESQPDRGQSHAINKGWQRATGHIIGWLNSDDLLLPNALREVAVAFEANPQATLVYGGTLIFEKNKKSYVDRGTRINFDLENLARMNLPQQSSFYKRKILAEQGFLDETFHYSMDFELFVRICSNYEVAEADATWAAFRQHAHSKTGTHLSGFFEDNRRIMSRLLRSLDGGEAWIEDMKNLGLYVAEDVCYAVSHRYSEENIRQIWLMYLEEVATSLRYNLAYEPLRCVLTYVETAHADFFRHSKKMKRANQLRHIPAFFIKKIRLFWK